METKLCRVCGKLGENYVHIFKTEGLKNKIETCLPIIVSPHCLLPDTICSQCLENVDNFYCFIKNCLQNIIVLESQYDILESCLKTKRKHEKYSQTGISLTTRYDKNIQTDEDSADILLRKEEQLRYGTYAHLNQIQFEKLATALSNADCILSGREPEIVNSSFNRIRDAYGPHLGSSLVGYDIDSDSSSIEAETELGSCGKVVLLPKRGRNQSKQKTYLSTLTQRGRNYFDDSENDIITEIVERKHLKRKSNSVLSIPSKMFKVDANRRKKRAPKKVQFTTEDPNGSYSPLTFSNLEKMYQESDKNDSQVVKEIKGSPLQVCLLCDMQFCGQIQLSTHVYEQHGIDMAQVVSSVPVPESKRNDSFPTVLDVTEDKEQLDYTSPQQEHAHNCPLCPRSLNNRTDMFTHLRLEHPKEAELLCGLCFHSATSCLNLSNHVDVCKTQHNITARHICKICYYSDDNLKMVENHVGVHDFVLGFCKRQMKVFNPSDYVETNACCETATKCYTCTACDQSQFESFSDFSVHRRSQHDIFHCDLCSKFYGRNSHLWKHVNRVHKGHPSITCQLCYRTSASKYHLAQHFAKIHYKKVANEKNRERSGRNNTKGSPSDAEQMEVNSDSSQTQLETLMHDSNSDLEGKQVKTDTIPPKEIDSSSDLYTNIITNYTPPQNEGEFKCPKCLKGFHKKALLKKHKKNCRPRLQKDLLTRCKTCSRVFKDRQSLTKHLVNYHSEYTCEICNNKFQSKCEIVSHIRFSHPDCHLFCTCGNILRSQADLDEHKQDHYNSFVCQFCGDSLPTKIKLKMHVLSLHRKILSLSCGICLKLFETQHILRDHVRLVHVDQLVSLNMCTVCGKKFGSKWKAYDHLNKSHGRFFKACRVCLDTFNSEEELQVHSDSVHANLPQTGKISVSRSTLPQMSEKEIYEGELKIDNSSSDTLSDIQNGSDLDENSEKVMKRVKPKTKGEETPKQESVDVSGNLQNSSKRTVYVNSNDPSMCEICRKTWPAKKHLWQHYIRCHKQAAATVCGICLKTNDNYETLQSHLKKNHPNLLHGQGFGSNLICRVCGRYHNASLKLRLHMAIHENFNWNSLEEDLSRKSIQEQFEDYLKARGGKEPPDDDAPTKPEEVKYENASGSENDSKGTNSTSDDEDSDDSSDASGSEDDNSDFETISPASPGKPNPGLGIKVESVEKLEDSSSDSDASFESVQAASDEDNNDSSYEVKVEQREGLPVVMSLMKAELPLIHQNSNLFVRKSEELDSAIRSISFEEIQNVQMNVEVPHICEVPPQSQMLNTCEIQSAVNSIL